MPADVEDANRDERHLFSGDIVAHTVESIVALDTEWRLRTLYFTTLLICVAAIAAIFIVKVDVSAMGAGLIRPLTDKMEIAAPLAGQVVEVIGRTDLRVKRGDRLMVLSTASLEANLAGNRAEQERAVRELHDLDFLVRLLGDYKSPDSPTGSKFPGGGKTEAVGGTRANLEPKPEIVVRPISANPAPETLLQSPVYAKDYASYLAEAEELRSNRDQAEHELRRYETLFVSNTVSGQEVDQRRYELQQTKLREETARKQRVTRWQAEFAARSRALDNLAAEAVRIREEMNNCTIKAPADGTSWTLLRSRQARLFNKGSVSEISPPTTRWWRKFMCHHATSGKFSPDKRSACKSMHSTTPNGECFAAPSSVWPMISQCAAMFRSRSFASSSLPSHSSLSCEMVCGPRCVRE